MLLSYKKVTSYERSFEWVARCDFKLWGLLNVWSHSPQANCLSFDSGMGDPDGGDLVIMGRELLSDGFVSFSQSTEGRDDE